MHAFGLFQKLMYILINDIVTTRTTQLLHGSLLLIKANIVFTFLQCNSMYFDNYWQMTFIMTFIKHKLCLCRFNYEDRTVNACNWIYIDLLCCFVEMQLVTYMINYNNMYVIKYVLLTWDVWHNSLPGRHSCNSVYILLDFTGKGNIFKWCIISSM